MLEIWKAVESTKGFIEVSNMGRIRSLLRGTPHILKTQTDKKGYHRVRVTIEREKMSLKVHREVAKAFIPNPDNLPQVNHIDGDKNNNTVGNLEWCTNKENAYHARALALHKVPLRVAEVNYVPKRTKVNGVWHYNPLVRNRYGGVRPWNNPNPKKPIIGTNGVETKDFDSISEAEQYLNSRHISDVLKGKRSHVKGWTFIYAKGGDKNSYSNRWKTERKTKTFSHCE